MSELVSNTSLKRALEKFHKQSENLNKALEHAQEMNLLLAAKAITEWLATCPREKAREAKALLVALCTQTHREALALLLIGTIDTESNRPPLLTRLRSWLHAHAPPFENLGADRVTPKPHLYPIPQLLQGAT